MLSALLLALLALLPKAVVVLGFGIHPTGIAARGGGQYHQQPAQALQAAHGPDGWQGTAGSTRATRRDLLSYVSSVVAGVEMGRRLCVPAAAHAEEDEEVPVDWAKEVRESERGGPRA
jgi:hypothetical protein